MTKLKDKLKGAGRKLHTLFKDHLKLSEEKILSLLGISQSALYRWYNRTEFTPVIIGKLDAALTRKYGINPEWFNNDEIDMILPNWISDDQLAEYEGLAKEIELLKSIMQDNHTKVGYMAELIETYKEKLEGMREKYDILKEENQKLRAVIGSGGR